MSGDILGVHHAWLEQDRSELEQVLPSLSLPSDKRNR